MKTGCITLVLVSMALLMPGAACAQDATAVAAAPKKDKHPRIETHNDNRPPCLDRFAVVSELSPFVGYNDFNGTTQTVEALGYARSQCIGSSNNRWRVEANIAHVGQKGYSAESALVGAGVEFHPLLKAPDFTLVPVVRLGYEHIPSGNDNLVWGGALTAENIVTLNFITRDVATTTATAAGTQLIMAGRVDYTNRNVVDTRIPVVRPVSNQVDLFGMLGVDSPFKGGRWRWQASGAYQSIDGGSVKGYASFAFAVRHLDETFENYHWNYQVIGNVGDHRFRAILLNISYRFTESRNISGSAQQ